MKEIYFISGLPRSGSTLIANLLKQNDKIHGESVSALATLISTVHHNWHTIETVDEYNNLENKQGLLNGMLQGYYSHLEKNIVFDKDRGWIPIIGLIEAFTQKEVKMIVCVRNPAEILTSFERIRRENPLYNILPDRELREKSSIASRAFYYSSPDGPLGLSHRNLQDAIVMGYLNRMLFIDYNRFCNSPRTQMKRIYDFFKFPYFEHNFEKIVQDEHYNHYAQGLPNLHKIKESVVKSTVNPVEYLGLELYEQYNREIFWNAWI